MDQYELIRTAHRVYGKSIREIRRETGHHRETIRKALKGLEPKYRRRKPTRCPVMDPVEKIIEGWLLGDRARPHCVPSLDLQELEKIISRDQLQQPLTRWVTIA